MNIQEYIESGILEEYCLGHLNEEEQAGVERMAGLYPGIKAELNAVEQAFEDLAALASAEPPGALKQNILAALGFADLDINNLPVIKHAENPTPWLTAFAHLMADEPAGPFTMHVVRHDEIAQQMLVTSSLDVPEEEHTEFLESLLVLKGRCECTIGGILHALGPGDFIEMPLNIRHDIKVITPAVTAVLQYRFC